MESVILLNADEDTVLKFLDWKRAMCLLIKGKVKVIEYSDKVVRTVNRIIQLPKIIKLIRFIKEIFSTKVRFSKRNLLFRDDFECGYCLCRDDYLTIDHIIPKSKGGKTHFLNCVSACKSCNQKKADELLKHTDMRIQKKLFQPTVRDFLEKKKNDDYISKMLKTHKGYYHYDQNY